MVQCSVKFIHTRMESNDTQNPLSSPLSYMYSVVLKLEVGAYHFFSFYTLLRQKLQIYMYYIYDFLTNLVSKKM